MINSVRGDISDQNYGPLGWQATAQITTKNALLHHLSVTNKGGSDAWVQIFDSANGGSLVIASTTAGQGDLQVTAHGFTTGTPVLVSGIVGITDGLYYARREAPGGESADNITVYDTAAHAADTAHTTGLQLATNDDDTGLISRVPMSIFCPANDTVEYARKQFTNGIFVHCTAAADGMTALTATDFKFEAGYMTHPLAS